MANNILRILLTVVLISLTANAMASMSHARVQPVPIMGTIQAVKDNGFTVRINNRDYRVANSTLIRYSGVRKQDLSVTELKPGMLVRISVPGGSRSTLSTITILPK